MKKPSFYLILRQKRKARDILRKKYKRSNSHYKRPVDRFVKPRDLIVAPENFNLTRGAGIEIVKFIRAFSNRVLSQKKTVKLDFRKTKTFFVPGVILLMAEINRVVSSSELTKPITILDPIQRRPREVLKQIGIHHLTDDKCDIVPSRDDVVYWRATKGADQSGDRLKILEAVAEKANIEHTKQVELSGIWRGVSEAVANTVDHAYETPRIDGFNGLAETKWWMLTQVKDQKFTAAVCDLGCGYSATINRFIPENFIAKCREIFIGENRDIQAIKTAMEYGRSGTRENNRGKGSRDALSVIEKHGSGELFIISNTGWVKYTYENSIAKEIECGSLGIDIRGTIIWWNLSLMKENHVHN